MHVNGVNYRACDFLQELWSIDFLKLLDGIEVLNHAFSSTRVFTNPVTGLL